MKALNWLNGKKTYIGIIAATLFSLAVSEGWIALDDWEWLAVLIAGWTGVAINHKANKIAASTQPQTLLPAVAAPRREMTLTETVLVREGDRCDQCGLEFLVGNRIYQRATGKLVCVNCTQAADLYVGRVAGKG